MAGNGEFPPAAGAASLDCGQSPRHDSAAGREISSWFFVLRLFTFFIPEGGG